MNFINYILPEKIIYSLGWTIIHSLWEGALIALLLFAFITLVKSSPAVKAKVSVIALGIMIISFFVTFSVELSSFDNANMITGNTINSNSSSAVNENNKVINIPDKGSFSAFQIINRAENFLTENIPALSLIWFAGFMIFTTRLFGGLYLTKKLKYSGTSIASAKWQNKVNSFKCKLKISKPVRILESITVNIPVVIGFIRPVILMPVGMLTGLPGQQVEAIIIHELAHIYRNDYLVNIIQSISEIILFYHPAAWWLSHVIRRERENSCDDIAVSVSGNRLIYAQALTNLEEIKTKNRQFALALKNNKTLLERVKRLFGPGKEEIRRSEKFFAVVVVFTILLATTVFAAVSLKHSKNYSQNNFTKVVKDSSWKKGVYNFNNDKIKVKMNNGKIEELFVGGERIPQDKIPDYKKMVEQTLSNFTLKAPEPPAAPSLSDETKSPLPPKAPSPVIPQGADKPVLPAVPLPENTKPLKEPEVHPAPSLPQDIAERMKNKSDELQRMNERINRKAAEIRKKNNQLISDLTKELVSRNIISEGEVYDIKLTTKELEINGEKQSDELLKKALIFYKKAWGRDMKDNSTFQINH